MRLHRLSLTAIGPFVEHTELDLARFGESGLFLIEGQTGSGKSTILDAISFALYGKPAQSSAALERLKSHHAAAGTEPVVELVFETQRGRYRIRRTPTFERPKKRGTGTTKVNMTVHLYRLTGADSLDGGELISHSLGDVEDEVTRAVGLSHGQFVQTVLLPQGEFASFLTAKTDVKRALLQRLFGTELLERTQLKLVEGRARAERLRRGAVEGVRDAVHAFAGAAALPEDGAAELLGLAESGADAGLHQQLADHRARLADEVAEAAERLADARRQRAAADTALRRETELQRRRELRAALRAQRDQLDGAADDYTATRTELAAAECALTVQPAFDGLAVAITGLDRAQGSAAAARAKLPEQLRDEPETALRAAGAAEHTLLGQLTGELRREEGLAARESDLAGLQSELAGQARQIERARSELAALPGRRAELATEQAAVHSAVAELPRLQAEHERANHRLVAARRAEVAEREAAQERQLVLELLDAAQRAEERMRALRTAWRASIASELGLALQSGDPCAVCGSVEHPKPARPAEDHVSQDQLRQAEEHWSGLHAKVESRKAQLDDLQATLVQLQIAAEQLSPELAQATLDKATAELGAARELSDRAPGLAAAIDQLQQQEQLLRQRLDTAGTAHATLSERADALRQAIDTDLALLAKARGGFESVADRVASVRTALAAIEAAAAAAVGVHTALAAAEAAGELFTGALTAAGFADQQVWQAAARTSAQLAELRRQVRSYEEQLASVTARLAADELADPALDGEPADLTALAFDAAQAEAAEQATAGLHGAAQDRAETAGRRATELERAVRQSSQVLEQTAAAIRVGNLVAGLGDNQLKMELTTYVLVRRFAEVLAAANTQLQRISQGRYQLEHTDARTGNARSGLNLRVLDLHTGRPRDPATLSGGETFYVSLALALGLADVVRAESGGIDLGTLFIDEGFGSLDAEVLDEVISVLDSLRHGGRAVGIVSHVSELKMRIADRIKVVRNVDGTSRVVTTV